MTDQELVLKLKISKANEDYTAFKIVYQMFYKSLLMYVKSFTLNTDEAKDIVQDCFIILWNKRKELDEDSTLKTYLFTIAYNTFINQHRKNQYKTKVIEELKLIALNNRIYEDDSVAKDRVLKLDSLIESLPKRCKEILILNKKEGLKYKDIAKTLNISEKTVESQMRIAFQKIREGFDFLKHK